MWSYYKWRVKFLVGISFSFDWVSLLCETVFRKYGQCGHFKLSFICRPKKWNVSAHEISLLLICKCIWETCLGVLWNCIYLILLKFNDNLLVTIKLLTLLSSLLITLSILLDCIVSTQQLNVVSSAYIINWKTLLAFGKSLIYI